MNITKCVLPSAVLKFSSKGETDVQISESLFLIFHAAGRQNIKFLMIDFHLRTETNHTLIKVVNSKIHMSHCQFSGCNNSIVSSISSHITIENILVERLKSPESILLMQNSKLTLRNVSFFGNGMQTSHSAVQLRNSSSAFVIDSNFTNNIAVNGSCFHVGKKCQLTCLKSGFHHNTGIFGGGTIYCDSNSAAVVESSAFSNNSAWHILSDTYSGIGSNFAGGGAIKCAFGVQLNIINSYFTNNSCKNYLNYLEAAQPFAKEISFGAEYHTVQFLSKRFSCRGGAIKTEAHCSVSVNNSLFLGNFADYGGAALSINDKSNVSISDSNLEGNIGYQGLGVFYAECNSCILTVERSTFLLNVGGLFLTSTEGDSLVKIISSHFANNTGNRVLFCENTTVALHACSFAQNRDAVDELNLLPGIVVVLGTVSLNASNCTFAQNMMCAIHSETTNVTLDGCLFTENNQVVNVMSDAILVVQNCEFSMNDGKNTGVIGCEGCGWISIHNSTFKIKQQAGLQ